MLPGKDPGPARHHLNVVFGGKLATRSLFGRVQSRQFFDAFEVAAKREHDRRVVVDRVDRTAVRPEGKLRFDFLFERAAQVVCDAILENYPKVQSVTVELKKPEAPINAVFDYVSVEMTRSRA